MCACKVKKLTDEGMLREVIARLNRRVKDHFISELCRMAKINHYPPGFDLISLADIHDLCHRHGDLFEKIRDVQFVAGLAYLFDRPAQIARPANTSRDPDKDKKRHRARNCFYGTSQKNDRTDRDHRQQYEFIEQSQS